MNSCLHVSLLSGMSQPLHHDVVLLLVGRFTQHSLNARIQAASLDQPTVSISQ